MQLGGKSADTVEKMGRYETGPKEEKANYCLTTHYCVLQLRCYYCGATSVSITLTGAA